MWLKWAVPDFFVFLLYQAEDFKLCPDLLLVWWITNTGLEKWKFLIFLNTLYASEFGVNARSMQSFPCMLDTTNKVRVTIGEQRRSKLFHVRVTQYSGLLSCYESISILNWHTLWARTRTGQKHTGFQCAGGGVANMMIFDLWELNILSVSLLVTCLPVCVCAVLFTSTTVCQPQRNDK